jgi:Flp pilus assembly protein TadB
VAKLLRRPFLRCDQCMRRISPFNKAVEEKFCSDDCAEARRQGIPGKFDENRARRAHELGNVLKGLLLTVGGTVLTVFIHWTWIPFVPIGIVIAVRGAIYWALARPTAKFMEVPDEEVPNETERNPFDLY